MINLLPPEIKQNFKFARKNRQLVRWICAFLMVIFGVAIITSIGLFFMNNSADSYRLKIARAQSLLASQNSAEIQHQVTDISNNLNLMVKVLSKEILFSQLLKQLGTITPSNVVLTNLSISQTASAIDIIAQTASYNAATQLQVNLADPNNQIFSKADIVDINCTNSTQAVNPRYPCTATIRALFTSSNPFLFINAGTQKAGS